MHNAKRSTPYRFARRLTRLGLVLGLLAAQAGLMSGCIWYKHEHERYFNRPYTGAQYDCRRDWDPSYWLYHDTEDHRWDEHEYDPIHSHPHLHEIL